MATRTRSTPYAILGFLSLAPMSGYDIRKEAATSIGHFWSESYGQIYPALRDLAADGLIRRRRGGPAGGRERQVYEITARGREALRQWRAQPSRSAPPRNELLLKLFFGNKDSAAGDATRIAELLSEETSRLVEYRVIRRQLLEEHPDHPSLPFWLATLSYGEHHSRSVARWCRETLMTLRALPGAAGTENPKK
jgi:PadR family transcriptional regulator AphA